MDVERRPGEEERRIAVFLHRLSSSERGQPEGRVPLAANRHVPGRDERREVVLDVRPPLGIPSGPDG